MFHRTLTAACLAALCASVSAAPDIDHLTFRASGPSPYAAACNGVPQTGTLYPNAEVEPFVAANPRYPLNLVGAWQQDRWSNGGSQGLGTAYSFDGGIRWHRVFPPFTRCAGGNAANGGDYERGSDPWVSFSPNGVVHQMVLAVSFNATATQPASAMLASRSTDGGRTWSKITTLVADTAERFNDKNALTADPTDSRYVYAIWDRLSNVPGEGAGPTLLARSTDNGHSWEPARIVYDPGEFAQTIGNRIEVLPDGTLVNLFTQIDYIAGALTLRVIRSADKGQTWSAPITVADLLPLGASDPETGAPIRDGAILAQLAISRSGTISAVWQDARFSGGLVDGIALSQSSDGGLTWSAPVQINRDPLVQAFTPSIHVRRDGSIGVTYYDLRSNTADASTLLTDTWLTRSRDGLTWRESRVTAAFDLARAPIAGGYFVGDYQGLTSIGPIFVPFFAKSGGGDANRNDVYAHFALESILAGAASGAASIDAQVAGDEAALPAMSVQGTGRVMTEVPAALRAAAWQAFDRSMRMRLPDWDARRAKRSTPP
jgi:BNR repeat-like domain